MSEKEVNLRCLHYKRDEFMVCHFFMEDKVVYELRDVILKIVSLFAVWIQIRI